jgi:hypothetical protein
MAGTVTVTHRKHKSAEIKKVLWDWLSDASGDATDTERVEGEILRVCFVPDGGGTQPSNSYDVTIKDSEEIDVLAGLGANLTNASSSQVVPVVTDGNAGNMRPVAVAGDLDLAVANAGNAKGGKIALYYR